MKLTVYGADSPCQSCLHAPTSKETMEWLSAALKRKFPTKEIDIRYIDIEEPETDEDLYFTKKIKNEEYFYPLVVAKGQVIGEGDPRLKPIVHFLETEGLQSV